MNEFELEKIVSFITEKIGIIPLESHKSGIGKFIEKKIKAIGSFRNYFLKIQSDTNELEELVNGSTVNETYFFREEKQFDLLKQRFFPEWINRNGTKPIKIWSAACSEGAEAYSLLLLASSCHVKSEILASDINTAVLKKCRSGVFKTSLLRSGDGEKYRYLVQKYINQNGEIEFDETMRSKIATKRINLAKIEKEKSIIEKQDIIFVRNVFIYFSRETRAKILKVLSENYLADGGIIFVSMNEIAQVDSSMTPEGLRKISDGDVFYFVKTK